MASQQHITIVYHQENQLLAQAFEKTFAKTDVQFHHLICREGNFSPDFNTTFASEQYPIVLLMSDNYLKSEAAMQGALIPLQNHINNQQISPIIINGTDTEGQAISTEFERIGQIIKYMNFWQDRYLSLRSEARKRGEIDDDLEIRIKNVREISTNIGEYLRFLRDQQAPHIDELVGDNFIVFKKQFGIEGDITPGYFNRFNTQTSSAPPPAEIPEPAAEKKEEINIVESSVIHEEEIVLPPVDPALHLENIITTEETETSPIKEIPAIPEPPISIVPEAPLELEVPEIREDSVIKMVPKKKFSIPSYLDDLGLNAPQEIPPINLEERLAAVRNYIDSEEFSSAKNELDQLGEKFPRDARVWKYLGNIAEQQADYIQACTHYSRALELDPTLPDLDYKVGLITSNFYPDQLDRAIQFFRTAIAKNSNHADAHYQLGILLNEKKRNSIEAIPIFEKVLEIAPDHEFANYDLALIYYDQGDKAVSLNYYQKAFSNNSELQTPENDKAFGFSEENIIPVETAPVIEVAPSRPIVEKTALITGATSGIGKATAHAFAEAGYRVIICGRRENLLLDLKEELTKENPSIRHLTFDVREISGIEAALNTLESPFSEIDLLINNAGLASGMDTVQEGDLRDWDIMIDTNIKGVLNMVRLISPQMVERGTGQIINTCSTAGHEVYPMGNVYCATKHAVDALTKGMRLDLHAHGIKVGQVSPAHVEETNFAKVRFHGDSDRAKIYDEFNPLKSSDVANVILYMASQPAHVNIQDILLMGTQQASSTVVDRSGRKYD